MRIVTLTILGAAILLSNPIGAQARLAGNTLAPDKLAALKVPAGTAAANPLAVGKKLDKHTFAANPAAVDDLLATEDGQELLSFIVSCALPLDTTLRATIPGGGELDFYGELGLAKSWIHHPLNATGKGWVSACLFARTNDHSVAAPLSLRGPHRALATTPEEAATWTLEEGAFYGDYFTSDDQSIACRGEDQAAGETGGLISRDCAEPDPSDPTRTQCDFIYAGDCGDFAAQPTCEHSPDDRHGFYRKCHAQPTVAHDQSPTFKRVITTFALP